MEATSLCRRSALSTGRVLRQYQTNSNVCDFQIWGRLNQADGLYESWEAELMGRQINLVRGVFLMLCISCWRWKQTGRFADRFFLHKLYIKYLVFNSLIRRLPDDGRNRNRARAAVPLSPVCVLFQCGKTYLGRVEPNLSTRLDAILGTVVAMTEKRSGKKDEKWMERPKRCCTYCKWRGL